MLRVVEAARVLGWHSPATVLIMSTSRFLLNVLVAVMVMVVGSVRVTVVVVRATTVVGLGKRARSATCDYGGSVACRPLTWRGL